MTVSETTSFAALGLAPALVEAIEQIGYEAPSSIQVEAIPPLLAGKDLLGQAQTGTGKTGAFALPLLSKLDLATRQPQILVLTPTRELAIQVAEAMQTYARNLPGFHVLPVYGGQSMEPQIRHLQRGVHAVVGTPGRILDHLRRGTLNLQGVAAVAIDEADEMLRMGFLEDVTEILDATPPKRQIALFSATMPPTIRQVAKRYLREPVVVRIKATTATVATVTQRYWEVSGVHKLTALTRILEVEDFDAMLIFVRTKNATTELAEKLEARGFAAGPLNGDMNQALREKTVERLKAGTLDIVVATDVAARGLHVERISHVVNYDVPQDPDAYVHRIGRTARAGKEGQAILFVAPRERFLLRTIERATGKKITPLKLPSFEDISNRRIARFKDVLTKTLAAQDLELFERIVADYARDHEIEPGKIAAALAFLHQKDKPFVPERPVEAEPAPPSIHAPRERPKDEGERRRYRIEVGRSHGAEPKHVVAAVANATGLEGREIGPIEIHETYSLVVLPVLSDALLRRSSRAQIRGRMLRMTAAAPGRHTVGSKAGRPSSRTRPRSLAREQRQR